ncbi:zinc finger CW-type PWWP domain protein 1 isoform X4 [Lepus europaeus]|uniref:zinc finger CW-type PWWP domain protein 1 isoform X4 n=1 Tax=Lepus europaeus TaxID=9983 RepID=UPI002B473C25|nr:zinc finger CW-type PWWP domain protein 1 isoform X4 [Lepus europaeus]
MGAREKAGEHRECGKGPKKTFAPPIQKLHFLKPCGPKAPKEEALGASSPEAEARPNLPKARLEMNEEKTTTENGPSSGQEKKGKPQDNKQNKQAEKKEKGRSSLTNAEFEEIVQTVLRKALQECEESSCAQLVVCTQSDKVPGIVASTGNDTADGERMMVIHTPEISAPQEDEVVPESRASKRGQPDPAPSEKKLSRPCLSKRKKEAQDEQVERVQGGHEHRQTDQPKKMIKDLSQIRGKQKEDKSGFGQYLVWVQCSSSNCEKWRRLHGNIDPSVLPDNWSCDQNTDSKYNSCDIPEETWTGCESEVAYATYIPGSIIWAKQWPGMIESDPDLGEYFLFASQLDSLPSKYHVTFFGETVSRAWIPVNMLKNFQELSLELAGVKKCRNKDCSQKLEAALMMAQQAEQIGIQERVNLFGFQSRYNGSDSSGEGKDLRPSESNSPESCLEKDGEEESEIEEESESEKKDPTLPSPKQAKIRTKNPKSKVEFVAGMTNGRGGTLPKKTMKSSLDSESTAPSTPIMRGEEDQRNSDPDQPGPKKKFKAPQSKASATSLAEEEVRTVPKGLTPQMQGGACPSLGKRPRLQEPAAREAEILPPEDEVSSDLDLEQLMEDNGKEPEEREEPQHRDSEEEFMALFEE